MGLPCTENNLKYETQHVVRSAFDDFDLLDTIETKSLTFAWSWILKTLSRNNKKQGQLRTEVGMGIGIGMELWIGTCTWCDLVLWEPSLPPFHFLFFCICENVRSCQKRRIPSYKKQQCNRGDPSGKKGFRVVLSSHVRCSLLPVPWQMKTWAGASLLRLAAYKYAFLDIFYMAAI